MVRIKDEDRIYNRQPPIDPNDPTEFNADKVMLIFDKIVNGEQRYKLPFWDSYENFISNAEEGEIGVVNIGGVNKIIVKLNGGIVILAG